MADRLRLLLVNDDADGLFLLNHAMQREFPEAETIVCRSAEEALTHLDASPVNLLITDNRMPFVSGIELVR